MLDGETVIVRTFVAVAQDPFGAPLSKEVDTEVGDVLVQPGATADVDDSNRPEGVSVSFTLHFPKTYNVPLRGAEVFVRDNWYDVVGDPQWHEAGNCPTRWNYPVEVSAKNG